MATCLSYFLALLPPAARFSCFSEKPLQGKMFSSEKIPRCLLRHINLPSSMCYCRVTVMASSAGVFRSALLEQIMESDNIHRAVERCVYSYLEKRWKSDFRV